MSGTTRASLVVSVIAGVIIALVGYNIIASNAATKTADLNSDGTVNIFDLSILLSKWSQSGDQPADINADNVVNIFDLSILLSTWGSVSQPTGNRYITGISTNGRYFVDQHGQPMPVWGDSPWEIMTQLGPTDVQYYLDNRKSYGVNALILSIIGSEGSGYSNTGETFDGILPFTNENFNQPNPTYWARMDQYLGMMRDRGMTAMVYTLDGWNYWTLFDGKSLTDCYNLGVFLGNRYKDYPNIMWMFGGDYFSSSPTNGSTTDKQMDAVMRGIKSTGDTRPFSIQNGYQKSLSTDYPYWEQRVNWNFVYTYHITYKAVFDGYNRTGTRDPRPSLFSEGDYENGTTGGGEVQELRRTMLWALTSGSPGAITGQESVWDFQPDWKQHLDTSTATQTKKLRDLFDTLEWWKLVPDQQSQFVTAGRGTQVTTDSSALPMQNNYATAAITPDGELATVYVPTSRTITLNLSKLAPGWTAVWVDPSNATTTQPANINLTTGQVTSPNISHDGVTDWLLLIK